MKQKLIYDVRRMPDGAVGLWLRRETQREALARRLVRWAAVTCVVASLGFLSWLFPWWSDDSPPQLPSSRTTWGPVNGEG
jgi:hypothetical protein